MSGIKGLDSHSYVSVIGCALEYRYIEVMHSSFQILIAVSTVLRVPRGSNCRGDAVCFFQAQRLAHVFHPILYILIAKASNFFLFVLLFSFMNNIDRKNWKWIPAT